MPLSMPRLAFADATPRSPAKYFIGFSRFSFSAEFFALQHSRLIGYGAGFLQRAAQLSPLRGFIRLY